MLKLFQTELLEKNQLSNDVWLFRFRLINPKEINFQAGQYLILKINNQPRLYSILSPNYIKDRVEFMIKIFSGGLASDYLDKLSPGAPVNFEGPAGVFTLHETNRNKIFLVTSTGIAPVYSMISSYIKKNRAKKMPLLYLFWGLKNYKDICFFNELKQLTLDNQQIKIFICLSREKDLSKIKSEDQQFFKIGRVNSVWEQYSNQLIRQYNNETMKQFFNNFDYYLCGSRQVVESLNQYLLSKDINKESIYFEKF